MIPEAREVRLTPKIRKVLEARCRAPSTPQGQVKRARIVLLAADGRSTRSIAKEVGVRPRIVSKWRHRDTRGLQAYLGHRYIQNTVRYAELAPERFKGWWKD